MDLPHLYKKLPRRRVCDGGVALLDQKPPGDEQDESGRRQEGGAPAPAVGCGVVRHEHGADTTAYY
jgi:hypothetical protein